MNDNRTSEKILAVLEIPRGKTYDSFSGAEMHAIAQKYQKLESSLEKCLSWLEERHQDAGGNANQEIALAREALRFDPLAEHFEVKRFSSR